MRILRVIVERSADIMGVSIDRPGRWKSRAAHAERRASPTACCDGYATMRRCARGGNIDQPTAQAALSMLEVDRHGFDEIDRKLLADHHREISGRPGGRGHAGSGARRRGRMQLKKSTSRS